MASIVPTILASLTFGSMAASLYLYTNFSWLWACLLFLSALSLLPNCRCISAYDEIRKQLDWSSHVLWLIPGDQCWVFHHHSCHLTFSLHYRYHHLSYQWAHRIGLDCQNCFRAASKLYKHPLQSWWHDFRSSCSHACCILQDISECIMHCCRVPSQESSMFGVFLFLIMNLWLFTLVWFLWVVICYDFKFYVL